VRSRLSTWSDENQVAPHDANLTPLEWGKLAAFALAFLYLAASVVKVLAN
jgi:hypothetical protein